MRLANKEGQEQLHQVIARRVLYLQKMVDWQRYFWWRHGHAVCKSCLVLAASSAYSEVADAGDY